MMSNKDNLQDIANKVYSITFTRDGGNDEHGDSFGGAPEHDLVISYRDWYRDQVGNLKPWELEYTPYASNTPLKLYARYLQHPSKSSKTAIVIHGITSNSLNAGPWARVFYDLGYNILTPDLRGHGPLNKDQNRNMGIYDSDDILLWAKELVRRNSNVEIVLFGLSMGGATALESSCKNNLCNVRAVISDCSFADLSATLAIEIKKWGNLSDLDTETTLDYLNDKLRDTQGCHIKDGLTVARLVTGKLPLLVIQGLSDHALFVLSAHIIYLANGRKPKKIHLVPGAGHTQCIAFGYESYKKNVQDFLSSLAG